MGDRQLKLALGREDFARKLPVWSQHPSGAEPRHLVGTQRISDWGFRSTEADGPLGGGVSRWYYWWDDSCQTQFDQLWGEDGDRVADDLADHYWFMWPWLIGKALITGAPETYERIMMFARSKERSGPEYIAINPHAIPRTISTWGAFQAVRTRRTWLEPFATTCPTCEKDFWNGDVKAWACEAFGPVRYCMDCCLQVRNGHPRQSWSKQEVVAALGELSAACGAIPQQGFSGRQVPHDGPVERRDRRMHALVNMPSVETIKEILGQEDWLGVLRASGLVGETWRPSRGTWCHASDGHRCRSLLEKSIDDWFSSHGIKHETEPAWPRHVEFNPSGMKRADWLLGDGSYVECAGMMESKEYAAKILLKRQLASALEIPLIVVGPTDMHRLDQIFSQHLKRQSP